MSFGQFQFRRDTAANWTSANPTLLSGELAIETDTGKHKMGDGTTPWISLAYGGLQGAPGQGVPTGGTINQILAKNSSTNYDDSWVTFSDTIHGNRAGGALHANATTSTAGFMAANDKAKIDNLWYDVTNYGISTANSGAANVTAFNALYAALPLNSTVYFPPGTYDFNAELTMNLNLQLRIMGAGKSRSILNNTSTTANLFRLSIAAYYYTFEELGFKSTVTKTAGAAIQSSFDNALMDIRRCEFRNQFIGVDWSGVGSGNVGTMSECIFNTPAASGFQIRINGANINTMITNCTINCTGVSAIGLEINQSGAIQMMGCDFIGGTNTMRVNATGVVSAVFATNCFFDQATLGSTVKFMGTFATSRVKFIQCGITTGAAGLAALEIAGTGSGTAIPEAIDFEQCDFYNNGFTGTTTGLLLTGVRGIDIKDCRISGFTNGVNLISYSAAGVTNFNIQGCTIGPTENFAGNATGILINAGSFAYGPSNISYNDLSGNTTGVTDNGTYTNNQLQFIGNIGYAVAPKAETPNTLLPAATVTRAGLGWSLPSSTLRVGSHLRITVMVTTAATLQIPTVTLKYGTNNSSADADQVGNTALGTGSAALGSAKVVADFVVNSATTAVSHVDVLNGNTGTTGFTNAALQVRGSAGPITIATNTNNFLSIYIAASVASAVTIRNVTYEVVQQ